MTKMTKKPAKKKAATKKPVGSGEQAPVQEPVMLSIGVALHRGEDVLLEQHDLSVADGTTLGDLLTLDEQLKARLAELGVGADKLSFKIAGGSYSKDEPIQDTDEIVVELQSGDAGDSVGDGSAAEGSGGTQGGGEPAAAGETPDNDDDLADEDGGEDA